MHRYAEKFVNIWNPGGSHPHHHQITSVIQEGGCFESFVFLRRRRGLWSPLLSSSSPFSPSSSLSSSSTLLSALYVANTNYHALLFLHAAQLHSVSMIACILYQCSWKQFTQLNASYAIQHHSQFTIIIATTTNILLIVFWIICILETTERGSDQLGWCRHKTIVTSFFL